MEIKVVAGDITKLKADAAIVNLFEGVEKPGGAMAAMDEALDGAISRLIAQGEIKGKAREVSIIHTLGKIAPERVAVVGLGKQAQFTLDRIREAVAEACKALRRIGATKLTTIVHGAGAAGFEPEKAAQAVAEGALLGLYAFREHITKEPEFKEIEELTLVDREESRLAPLQRGATTGRVLAEATNLARDMINQPANHMTPSHMAEIATDVAARWGLECSVMEREEMEKLGMGALLGVAQGSRQPPKFIVLKYRGAPDSERTLGFLGKGLTFDSGGISIKPSEGLGEMKSDMAGGAAVIAALRALAELKARVNVTGLVPATENMPGGAALKPADIVRALNGKTIEVANTDAEGRLILADALSYANRLGLSPLVDVATLTGACRVALGDIATGAMGNDQELIDRVVKAGEEAGEKVWQLPMYEEYKEQNKSDVADVKNTGGRYAGAITAAQFLAEFAADTPWVHLDIAGPAFRDKERGYQPKGATGVIVRTLVNLALAME